MRVGEPERGVPSRDLLVESVPALGSGGRGEGGAQGRQARRDLFPCALRAVVRALARRPGIPQPLGLLYQALGPLEEGAVGLGVLPDGGRGQGAQSRVRRGALLGPPTVSGEPVEGALQGPREGA